MSCFVRRSLFALLLSWVPFASLGTTITQTALDLPDSQGPGGDLWEFTFGVSGFTFAANQGFSIGFDPDEYSQLLPGGTPASPDWDVLLIQPDPQLPDFGAYDALALVANADLSGVFVVRAIFTGAGAPGTLPFTVNEFDANGALIATLESGSTTLAPEPELAALLAFGAVAFGLLLRRGRTPRARRRRRDVALLSAVALLLGSCVPVVHTVQVGAIKLEYRQTASTRVGRTLVEYTFSIDVTNTGSSDANGLTGSVTSNNAATVIVDGALVLGNVAAGQKVANADTFTIRQDRTQPFSPAQLVFQVSSSAAPNPPSGLSGLPADQRAILAWTADASSAATYNVYSGTAPTTLSLLASGLTAAGHQASGLANGTGYFFAVTTVIAGVESAQSAPVLVTPPRGTSTPPAPTAQEREMVNGVRLFSQLLGAGVSAAEAAVSAGLKLQPDGALRVTVATNGPASSLAGQFASLGAREVVAVDDRADLTLPPGNLPALAAIPEVESVAPIVLPVPAQIKLLPNGESEGASVTGARDLHARDVRGRQGGAGQPPLRVAIIENGFHKSGAAWAKIGPHVIEEFCPAFATPCPGYGVADAFDDPANEHGNASAEVVLAMAPDVELVLLTTAGPTGMDAAVTYLLGRNDIDVVTVSLSDVMEDFYDGSSLRNGRIENLASSAIVTWAAGNNAEAQSLNDTFNPDANDFHQFDRGKFSATQRCDQTLSDNSIVQVDCLPFDPAGYDNNLWLQADEYARASSGLGASDLDLVVYDQLGAGLPVVESVDALGPHDLPTDTLPVTDNGATYFVAIYRETSSGANPRFRLRSMGGAGFFDVPVEQSRGSLGGSAAQSVLSVAALTWYNFDNASYSGRGPTGDGRRKPDIAGPSEVSNQTFGDSLGNNGGAIGIIGSGYNGTSAATPHVAGVAALMIDECIQWNAAGRSPTKDCTPSGIRLALTERALDIGQFQSPLPPNDDIVNDPPNTYGAGRADVLPRLVYQAASGGIWMRDPTHFSDFLDGRRQLTAGGANPDLSPDGKQVVYECTRNGFPELCIVDVDTLAVTMLALGGAATQTAQQPSWSPDGTQIAYAERNRFLVGGTLSIAFVLKIYTPSSGQIDAITSFYATSSDNFSAFYPSWSPQGSFLLFTKMTPQPGFGGARAARWDLAEVSTNARNVRLDDPAIFAVTSSTTDPGLGAARGHLSPVGDGRIVYMRLTEAQNLPPLQRLANGEIRVMKGRLNPSLRIAPGNDPRWSPGGSYLAWSRYGTPGNPATSQVVLAPFIADDTGASLDQAMPNLEILVTNGQQQDQAPSW